MAKAFQKPNIALAGISSLGIILADDVAYLPKKQNNEFVSVLPKLITKDIQYIDFVRKTANTKADWKLTPNGMIYTYKTEMLISVVRTEVLAFLYSFVGKELFSMEEHRNGRIRLVGTKDFPARMEVSEDLGTDLKSANTYKVTITAAQSEPALFFKENIYRVFDNSFDLTFN